MGSLRAAVRDARYALPQLLERILPGPGARAAARRCDRLARRGLKATVGYFGASDARPDAVLAANIEVAAHLSGGRGEAYLSVKAPALAFDAAALRIIAEAAAAAGLELMFDAHAPKDADRTLDAAVCLLADFPGTGVVLPARWRRSMADAARFRDGSARLRLVKGEWPDPEWPEADTAAHYLELVRHLAGRSAPIAVATHDPGLAERALTILAVAGTPCELELLRGLPARRAMAVARRLGVPVRLYIPFGPGWWPYAVDKVLARPYLLAWLVKDRLGSIIPRSTPSAISSAIPRRAPGSPRGGTGG